jgi:hypothetical protein
MNLFLKKNPDVNSSLFIIYLDGPRNLGELKLIYFDVNYNFSLWLAEMHI